MFSILATIVDHFHMISNNIGNYHCHKKLSLDLANFVQNENGILELYSPHNVKFPFIHTKQ